jgi:hypothetical protein
MNTNNTPIRVTVKALLNDLANQGRNYDKSYAQKLCAVFWYNSYGKTSEELDTTIPDNEAKLMVRLFDDVLLTLEILGLTPKDIATLIDERGLRESLPDHQWRKSHE